MSQARAGSLAIQKQEMWERVLRVRGFGFGLHKVLAEADWEFMKRLEDWVEFVYLSDRHIDRRVKELIVIGILGALRSPPEHIHAHINAAVKAGATKEEVIVVAELVGNGGGAVARANVVEAWRRVFAPELPAVFELTQQEDARVNPSMSKRRAQPATTRATPDGPKNVATDPESDARLASQKQEMSDRVVKSRGFGFGLHTVLAEADWEFMKKLQEWVEFVYVSDRHMDRRVRELIITGILGAGRNPPEQVQAHISAGVKAGVTRDEVILVAELVGYFGGGYGQAIVVEAWRREFAPELPPVFKPMEAK